MLHRARGQNISKLSCPNNKRGRRDRQNKSAYRPPVRPGIAPPPAHAALDRKDQAADHAGHRDRPGHQPAVETAKDLDRCGGDQEECSRRKGWKNDVAEHPCQSFMPSSDRRI